MARFLKFQTGNRLLFVGEPSSLPISFRPEDTIGRDPSRLNRIITNHIDTEQEYQQVLNLAQSYNLAAQPIAGKRAAHDAVVRLVAIGRIVAVEVEDLTNETPMDAATGQNIANMDMTAKAGRVYDLLPKHMEKEAWEELQGLLDPTTLAIALGLLILAFTSGIGAAIMIGVGWTFLGWSIFEAVDSMWKFVNRFSTAESDHDLNECAKLLADAIAKLTVGFFVKILTKGAGKVAKTKGFSGKGKSSGAGNASEKSNPTKNNQSSGASSVSNDGSKKAGTAQRSNEAARPTSLTQGQKIKARQKHHNRKVQDVRAQMEADGSTFLDRSGQLHIPPREKGRIAVPDLIGRGPDNKVQFVEVKTGNAVRSPGQDIVYESIGDAVPSPRLARELGIPEGVSLKNGLGYVPEVVQPPNFPGVGI